jgi:small subunit ribosomal protein S14
MLLYKIKDLKLRNKYLKSEYKLKSKKFVFINLVSNTNFDKITMGSLYKTLYLKLLKKNTYKNKILNRCLITDRTKSVYKPFNLSRSIFKDLLQLGLVPGYKKAAW